MSRPELRRVLVGAVTALLLLTVGTGAVSAQDGEEVAADTTSSVTTPESTTVDSLIVSDTVSADGAGSGQTSQPAEEPASATDDELDDDEVAAESTTDRPNAPDLLLQDEPLSGAELFPAQHVAELLRQALTDPRNEALWSGVEGSIPESALATTLDESEDVGAVPGLLQRTAEGIVDDESTDAAFASQSTSTGAEDVGLIAPPIEPDETTTYRARLESLLETVQARWGVASVAIRDAALNARQNLGLLQSVDLTWSPWLLLAAAAAVMVFGWIAARAFRWIRRRRAAPSNKAVRTARKLARRGIKTTEVARRTGLSREVIHLIEVLREKEARQERPAKRKRQEVA